MSSRFLLAFLLVALSPVWAIWPVPRNYTAGTSVLFLNQNLKITYNGQPLAYTHGYEPSRFDSKDIVRGGVSRALSAIFLVDFVPWKLHPRGSDFEPDVFQRKTWVQSLAITQTGKDTASTFKPLAGQVDESYSLTVSEDGHIALSAGSSTGVLRGLETFAQLFYKHSTGTFWYTPLAPLAIEDAPRYPHRGLLMDVARNWFEVSEITKMIDALSWNKMNRLHVHVTDSQSWPLEIPALPEVSRKGAYRPDLTYTPEDIRYVQEYGVHRGVEVYFEIDMPGHIGVVSLSHPELITAYDAFPYYWWCAEPPCGAFRLNDTAVDSFLEKLFDDLLPRVAPYSAYFHTGGDELNANDSMLDPGLRTNASGVLQPLLQKFIDTQHSRVRKAGLTPLVWEEIPLDWNVTLGRDTVVQTWLGGSSVKSVTSLGHKVIDSDYNFWYLDCGRGQWLVFENGAAYDTYYPFNDWCGPAKPWQVVYSHDPAANLTEAEAALVLGGEVAMWSETTDAANIDALVWPRAGAAAEVLWSGRNDAAGVQRSQLDAAPRLSEMRERMLARGVNAAPVQMIFCTQAANATECSYPA